MRRFVCARHSSRMHVLSSGACDRHRLATFRYLVVNRLLAQQATVAVVLIVAVVHLPGDSAAFGPPRSVESVRHKPCCTHQHGYCHNRRDRI